MCVGFFFFTQKTAYEMRISDWSSDVCSSDLQQRLGALYRFGRQAAAGLAQHRQGERRQHRAAVERARGAADEVVGETEEGRIAVRRLLAQQEIGRAACRARVGQYE